MEIYRQTSNGKDVFFLPIRSHMKAVNHRGYNTVAPENTMPAYKLSVQMGFRYVETDISFTSDNVPVLLHDATIDRTSNGTGSISSMTLAQARTYDFGAWKAAEYAGTKIPTLEEFLIFCRNSGLHPYLELKDNGDYTQSQIRMVVDMVHQLGLAGNVTYISFSSNYLDWVKEYDPFARLGYVVRAITQTQVNKAIALRSDYNEVFFDNKTCTAEEIALCKANGMPLEMWTISTKAAILALDDYVSGVTSNSANAEFVKFEQSMEE